MAITNKKAEKAKNPSSLFDYLSILVLIAGVALFYTLKINIWLKWGVVFLAVVAALSLFYFVSPTGVKLHGYFKDSWTELGKIVWPTSQETVRFTMIVFAFVAILALFLWLVDSGLSWLFYNIILGRSS